MAKVALLVGVSEYEPGLNPLPGAAKDVDAIREVLLHSEMGGFTESDIVLLKNPERQDMEMAIETLFSGRQKDDLVLLYFSGHGIKDDRGRLYLATRTTRKTTQGELIRSTAVSANFIHDRMSESRSRRQVVILDSCFSGAFAEGLSAKDDGTVDIREQLGGEGRVVLTSSSSTQYSFEELGQDLSTYTRFLIEGIRTGEADMDEDEFISIDELHEYASRKVRELQPAMKPEIYAIREGFKIRLAKVAPGDPSQRYRKEVTRFIHRGEISFVGRRTLDVLQNRLGLEASEAKAIEDEILEPYRKEFREKLQQYEQVFTELLERDETITESDRHDLQNLQQILGLRNEDTMPIEAQVTARFKSHQENLQAYEQAFGVAIWQEYPLSAENRDRLWQMQQQLNLTTAEIEVIESRLTAEVQAYHQKLQEYERLFTDATQQEYPLSEASRTNLCQQQQRLGLKDNEIAPIEAKITTQVESYQQKLQQYEQAYIKASQRKHYPDDVTRKLLQQTWQILGLSEIGVETIESRINTEIKTYQENLRQYEQLFSEAVQQEYPLSSIKRAELTERYRSLNLTAEDVETIEKSIVEAIEEHQQKLQQYEQVLVEAINFEYPLNEETKNELRRFQLILELTDQEVTRTERQILEQGQFDLNEDVNLSTVIEQSNTDHRSRLPLQEVNQQHAEETQSDFSAKKTQTIPASQQLSSSNLLKNPLPSGSINYRIQQPDQEHVNESFPTSPREETSQTHKFTIASLENLTSNEWKFLLLWSTAMSLSWAMSDFLIRSAIEEKISLPYISSSFLGREPGWFTDMTIIYDGFYWMPILVWFPLGIAQSFVLRKRVKYSLIWILLTTLGGLVGSYVFYSSYSILIRPVFFDWLYSHRMLVATIYGLSQGISIGIAQWLILRRLVFRSILWIFTTSIGIAIGGVVASIFIESSSIVLWTPLNAAMHGFVAGLVSALFTGIALVVLMRNTKRI